MGHGLVVEPKTAFRQLAEAHGEFLAVFEYGGAGEIAVVVVGEGCNGCVGPAGDAPQLVSEFIDCAVWRLLRRRGAQPGSSSAAVSAPTTMALRMNTATSSQRQGPL